jgi:predicted O-methyltransferase YrrM
MSHLDVEQTIERWLPLMPGWCTPEKGKRMAALARGASLCVELGVFGGRSLVSIALGLRYQSIALALRDQPSNCGRVDGIDPFTATAALEGTNDPANDQWWSRLDYEAIARAAQEAIYKLELMPYAHLVRMTSQEAVGFYADGAIDLLHADSNHSPEVSTWEVEHWAPKLKSGGIWIADDTNWPSTASAQKRLSDMGFQKTEEHGTWAVYRAP